MSDDELNERIAREVMGWTRPPGTAIYPWWDGKDLLYRDGDFLAPDWSGVRLVVERMEALGWDGFESRRVLGLWRVSFWMGGGRLRDIGADTLPRAVCLAALRALGKGEK